MAAHSAYERLGEPPRRPAAERVGMTSFFDLRGLILVWAAVRRTPGPGSGWRYGFRVASCCCCPGTCLTT